MHSSQSLMKTILLIAFFATVVAAAKSEAADIHWCPGLIGLTTDQTLRINVSNFGAHAVFVGVKVFDIDGNLVQEFRSESLDPRKTRSLDFNNGELGPIDLRVVVDYGDPDERSPKKLIQGARASIEIIDDLTGKTEVFYAPGDALNSTRSSVLGT